MSDRLLAEYTKRYRTILEPIATSLEHLILDHVRGIPHVDRVVARAKTPERFVEKAKRRQEDGSMKYASPLTQIQDQIGARVVVFYPADVANVGAAVSKYFTAIEERIVVPDSEWAFGYFGKHYVLALPNDVFPKDAKPNPEPRFFELQIKTLFQHAWSEANHDLGYKPIDQLSNDQKRRIAFTAAQAWGADRMFDELAREVAG